MSGGGRGRQRRWTESRASRRPPRDGGRCRTTIAKLGEEGDSGGGRESRASRRPPHDGGRCRTTIAKLGEEGDSGGGRESRASRRPPHDGGRCRTTIAKLGEEGDGGGGRESRASRRPPHDGGRCRTTIARLGERGRRRRWTGIEPAGRGSPVPPALKAGEPTRRSDTSRGDPSGQRPPHRRAAGSDDSQAQTASRSRAPVSEEGCRSLDMARASIWRIRSRVRLKCSPTSSRVRGSPRSKP